MTQQAQHTPGPWKFVKDPIPFYGSVYHRIKKDNDTELPIAMLWEGGGTKGKPTQLANARLIAAAPELLEACKKVHIHPGMQLDKHIDAGHVIIDIDAFDAIQKALAKAEGRE